MNADDETNLTNSNYINMLHYALFSRSAYHIISLFMYLTTSFFSIILTNDIVTCLLSLSCFKFKNYNDIL